MSTSSYSSIFTIIREVDLAQIKNEVLQSSSLLILGETDLATELAEYLSHTPDQMGVHPWLYLEELPLRTELNTRFQHYQVALLVSREIELDALQAQTLLRLHEANVPTIMVVINEMAPARVGADLARRYETARVVLSGLNDDEIQDELIPVLTTVMPDNRELSLARQFPALRVNIIQELIEETSRANAIYATSTGLAEMIPVLNIPLNVADLVILTKNQLIMAYKIALANGKDGEPTELMGEVIGVIGAGFLFREIARKLVGLIPVIGIVPKVAVSYAGTIAIGHTVNLWASKGVGLESGQMRDLYDDAWERGKQLAKNPQKESGDKASVEGQEKKSWREWLKSWWPF